MANEILHTAATGGNYYAVVQSNPFNQFANGTVLENFNASHWTNYAVTLVDSNTLGEYMGAFPALAEARYRIFIFSRAGGSPATTDKPPVDTQIGYWDGTQLLHDAAGGVFLALNQGDVGFSSLQNNGNEVATDQSLNPTIGGAFSITLTFNDTNGSLITASPFIASITNGVITENHTASNFTTSLGTGTYGIAAAAPGYSFTPTTLTVSASGSSTFQMTQIIITPPTPGAGQVLAQGYTRDAGGNIIANGSVDYEMLIIPVGTGNAFTTTALTVSSDGTGFFSFLAFTGSQLSVRVHGDSKWTNSQLVPAVDFWLNNFS